MIQPAKESPAFAGKMQYGVAKGYVQAMFAMMASPLRFQLPDDRTLFAPFSMLSGFAIELYLKAYLAHRGFTENDLRNKRLGHNLEAVCTACEAEGLKHEGIRWLVDNYGPHHQSNEYRYMKSGSSYQAHDLQTTFAALSHLDRLVDQAIGANAAYNLKPDVGWIFPADGSWRLSASMG